MKVIKNRARQYCANTRGNFGMWTAVMCFPIMVIASLAVDYTTVGSEKQRVKGSLDMAVLAAASNNKITDTQKAEFAKTTFQQNYTGNTPITLDVSVKDSVVQMNAIGEMKRIFSNPITGNSMSLDADSQAIMERKHTICVLALAETGADRVSFVEQTQFNSPTCVVQSNSSHAHAILSDSTSTPIAKSSCSSGGAAGDFEPFVRGECRPVRDPYANRNVPKPGACMPEEIFNAKSGASNTRLAANELSVLSSFDRSTVSRLSRSFDPELLNIPMSSNRVSGEQVLYPGTYCGGLTLDSKNVTLLPGTYIIKDGPLTIKNGADVYADRVALVTTGDDAVVVIETGAKVYLKAPKVGSLAGLAIVQDATPNPVQSMNYPDGINIIASGGELDVIGALYFPTQALDISGTSRISANAPATSFIAYDVTFAGQTRAEIKIDHVAAGIPPMLPLADDAARLVR